MAGTSPNLTIEENLSMADRRGRSRGLALGVTNAKRERFAEGLKVLELGLEDRLKTKVGAALWGSAAGTEPADGHVLQPQGSAAG